MQLRQLEYFISLCETLSFTRTAAEYFVSQTAVTQQIKALETELKTTLFDRTRRRVSVTAAGQLFYADAKMILQQLLNAEERVRLLSGNELGTLKLGILRGYEKAGVSEAIRQFHEQYPNVSLSLTTGQSATLHRELQLGNLDLILAHRFWDSWEGLDSLLLKKYPLRIACPKTHPFAALPAVPIEDLKGHRVVAIRRLYDGAGEESVSQQFYMKAGILSDIAFQSDDNDTILLAIAAGLGFSLLPEYLTQNIPAGVPIEIRPIIGLEEIVPVAAIWSSANANPLIGSFLKICRSLLVE